ncbi:MAG: DUF480 domain-containing protein [Ilumatobacter sp.]|nr:DUF480 domain-containing protein [Ilumatobacter sp.]
MMNDVVTDLTAEEARVLACLIEKEATTPDNYPMTVNALRNACNQSTSRDPVMAMTDAEVSAALASLRERGLTRTVHSTSNRATKYRHVAPEVYDLRPAETALLAVLLLRGHQTVGELKSRTARQHEFESTEEVAETLAGLAARPVPLVVELERRPGQKDRRWADLVSEGSSDSAVGSSVLTSQAGAPADVACSTDPYGEATAEFYDLLATAEWESFGLQLLDLLDGVDPREGPIVDVGCGTGIGLPHLLAAVPGARIHGIEPSKAMRTALHARLADDASLRSVTTVDPRQFADAALPERACAIVVNAALGHLSDAERARLWRYIAEQMPAGAPAVIEVLPPSRPVTVPPTRYRAVEVGAYVYEGWQEGEPLDDRTMCWTMTYKVLDGSAGPPVAEYRVRAPWRCWSADDVRTEIKSYGLVLREHDHGVVVSSRTGDRAPS